MNNKVRQFVSFDWAMKKLLRSTANFGVLNGFLSELMDEDIRIVEVLEGEGERENASDKCNRVDLLVKDSKDRYVVVEVQYRDELDYFQRMLYGTSKVVTGNIARGEPYARVKRVVSVNLVYFSLGQGEDYVYCGQTRFVGRHKHDQLELSEKQKALLECDSASDIFPTYYILRINDFDDIAKDGLDQWIYFLKNESLPENFNAKGLEEASEKLSVMKLSGLELEAYEQYEKELHIQASEVEFSIKRAEKAEAALEEERRQKEEERRQKEEERRQKEEERRQKELLLVKLKSSGMSDDEIQKLLQS